MDYKNWRKKILIIDSLAELCKISLLNNKLITKKIEEHKVLMKYVRFNSSPENKSLSFKVGKEIRELKNLRRIINFQKRKLSKATIEV